MRHKIGCVPVVSDEMTFVGLVTETDLLTAGLLPEPMAAGIAKRKEETIMSEWRVRFQKELDEVRRVRDELNVRIHLAKAEAKDRWDEL